MSVKVDVDAAEIRALSRMVESIVAREGSAAGAAREIGISDTLVNQIRRLAGARVNRTFSSETIEKIKRAYGADKS